jgi:uncharacterized membrane protein
MMKRSAKIGEKLSQYAARWSLRTLLLGALVLIASLVVVASVVVVSSTSSMKQAASAIAADGLPKAS